MPTNVTAEYKNAQQAFRQARDPHERLVCLKEMLRTLPKHKGRRQMGSMVYAEAARERRDVPVVFGWHNLHLWPQPLFNRQFLPWLRPPKSNCATLGWTKSVEADALACDC